MYMHAYTGGGYMLCFGNIMILYVMSVWWRDVVREATYQGHHTLPVQIGLRYVMLLFIVSEIMFFFFFVCFFILVQKPNVEIGAVSTPKGITVLNPCLVPFLNTVILLSSGAAVTCLHHAILAVDTQQAIVVLLITILLALIFTFFQAYEYKLAPFTISDVWFHIFFIDRISWISRYYCFF